MTTQNPWVLNPVEKSFSMRGLAVSDTTLYATLPLGGDQSKINLINITNGNITNIFYLENLSGLYDYVATDGTYLYYVRYEPLLEQKNVVYKYNISTSIITKLESLSNNTQNVFGLSVYGEFLYVAIYDSVQLKNTISVINTSTGDINTTFDIGEVNDVNVISIAVDSTYIYTCNYTKTITKYLIASPHTSSTLYTSPYGYEYTYGVIALDSSSNYLYALTDYNYTSGVYITKIALNSGTNVNNWNTVVINSTGVEYVGIGLAIDTNYVYANAINSNNLVNYFGKFALTEQPPTPSPTPTPTPTPSPSPTPSPTPIPTPTPIITTCTPAAGLTSGNTTITITGTNLTGVNSLTFGNNLATIITKKSTQIVATTPSGSAGAVSVSVNGVTSSVQFRYCDNAQTLADFLVTQIQYPATYTSPLFLTTTQLNNYFTTLNSLNLSSSDYLTYRQTLVDTLFTNTQSQYSLTNAIPTINIQGNAFSYSQSELTATTPSSIDTTKPKTLINFAVNNYYIQDLKGVAQSSIVAILNQFNEGSYVNMPNINGKIFTYVFERVAFRTAGNIGLITVCPATILNVYVQIDVVVFNTVPTYRIKLLTGSASGQLASGSLYIITNYGSGVNWSTIDATYTSGKVYGLYTIIQYNGSPITGTGYSVDVTTLQQTVGYSPAQTTMTINQTILDLTLSFTFMMGSINALGGIITELANSNICFPAGTPVKTDQGIMPIESIDTTQHTINGHLIQHITQTITLDPYLICFEKDALERNYPNQTTIMTKDHKIMYKGQLVPAYRFLNMTNNVKKVKYSGEVLYNVLLEDYSTMSVNNLVCETLHPNNVIARLHSSNFSDTYKQSLISIMNDTLRRKDELAYKNIVNRI